MLRPRSEFARCQALIDALEEERPGDNGVLHVEHLFSSWATRQLPRAVTYLLCLEVVDWGERTAMSMRERIDLLQMRRATKRLFRSHPSLIAMTDRLATEVERYGLARPPVAPVGIDLSLYSEVPFVEAPVLGVIGSMHWYPSRAAAERVLRLWPEIRARVPDATLLVGGWSSERYLGRYFPLEGAELVGRGGSPGGLLPAHRRVGLPAASGKRHEDQGARGPRLRRAGDQQRGRARRTPFRGRPRRGPRRER